VLRFAIVAVQVVLLAAPEAPRAETSSRCAEFGKPAPPARVDGSVVTRDRKPRSGVAVRATLPETGRVYTTTSDREGRFALDGFDSDVTLDLELGDASMKAWCSLRITRKQPVRAVTVVLDRWLDDDAGSDVGCEGLSRWSGQGHIEILHDDHTQAAGGAPEKPARLELQSRDIVRVSWADDGAAVLMNEIGRKAIEAFTAANLNRPGMLTIDGMSTSKRAPVIYGVVDSGVLGVSEDALRGPLCKTLEDLPQATR
jgi:hypothetical protein